MCRIYLYSRIPYEIFYFPRCLDQNLLLHLSEKWVLQVPAKIKESLLTVV